MKLSIILLGVCFLLFSFVAGPAVCTVESHADPQSEIIREPITIDRKSEHAIFSGERQFTVTDSTTILCLMGNPIALADLSVPCDAEIEFLDQGTDNPLCVKIEVKRLHEDSEDSD